VCARRFPQRVKLRRCIIDIRKGRHPANPRHCFNQNLLSFAVKVDREDADARSISIRTRQRSHLAGPQHIVYQRNNRNCLGRLLRGPKRFFSSGCDDIDPCPDQFCRILRNQIKVLPIWAPFNDQVLTFNKAAAPKFFQERNVYGHIAGMG